jgi:membrane-bound lytic murein transglycosylase D
MMKWMSSAVLVLTAFCATANVPTDTLTQSVPYTDSILKDDPVFAVMDSILLIDFYANDKLYISAPDSAVVLPDAPEVPDSVIAHRLDALDAASPMDLAYNDVVRSYIDVYVNRRREQMSRMMGLANYYFPLFEERLDKYQIPLEMKHLAIVESALNPRAKSRVGATGLWQFMYSTGKIYDLRVSSYVDERSDPLLATEAACQFMTRLYEIYGDWNLVLAAYNSGPGNVNKAIRRSGGKRDYWEIRPFLPRETRGYVPAFIAVNYAMNYAEEHLIFPSMPAISYYETDTVKVNRLIRFDDLSVLLGVSMDELRFLNPSYQLEIIPFIEGRDYYLTLPIDKMGAFIAHEDSIYNHTHGLVAANEVQLPEYVEMNDKVRYRVKSGDYLGRIAAKYGCSVRDIMRWNGMSNTNIRAGQYLTVYVRSARAMNELMEQQMAEAKSDSSAEKTEKEPETETKQPENQEDEGQVRYYTVEPGDTLWDIARKYNGVTVDQLIEWNNIQSENKLKPGMKLKIISG